MGRPHADQLCEPRLVSPRLDLSVGKVSGNECSKHLTLWIHPSIKQLSCGIQCHLFSSSQSFVLLKCFLVLFRFSSLLSLWNTHLPVKNFVALTRHIEHIDVCFPFSGCIRPSTVQHGSTNLTDTNRSLFPVGTVLQYSCDPGYLPVGRSVLTCTTLGYWSSEPPRCIHSDGKDTSQIVDEWGQRSKKCSTPIPSLLISLFVVLFCLTLNVDESTIFFPWKGASYTYRRIKPFSQKYLTIINCVWLSSCFKVA